MPPRRAGAGRSNAAARVRSLRHEVPACVADHSGLAAESRQTHATGPLALRGKAVLCPAVPGAPVAALAFRRALHSPAARDTSRGGHTDDSGFLWTYLIDSKKFLSFDEVSMLRSCCQDTPRTLLHSSKFRRYK